MWQLCCLLVLTAPFVAEGLQCMECLHASSDDATTGLENPSCRDGSGASRTCGGQCVLSEYSIELSFAGIEVSADGLQRTCLPTEVYDNNCFDLDELSGSYIDDLEAAYASFGSSLQYSGRVCFCDSSDNCNGETVRQLEDQSGGGGGGGDGGGATAAGITVTSLLAMLLAGIAVQNV